MNSIREIQRLNKLELEQGIQPSASWHTDYRDTAYVYIGGLSFDLTEGDIITIFSQFGEPTFVKLARDKTTGKSRGFAWLKYEDQRSCDLAVDNLGGATILGRVVRVDHARYKKRDDEEEDVEAGAQTFAAREDQVDTDSERGAPNRPLLPEEIELRKMIVEHDDEDPMKEYLIDEKKREVEKALERQKKKESRRQQRDHKRHDHHKKDSHERQKRRDRSSSEDGRDIERRRHRHRDRDGSPSRDSQHGYSRRDRRYGSSSPDEVDRPERRRRTERVKVDRRRDETSERRRKRSYSPGEDRRSHRHRRSRSRSP